MLFSINRTLINLGNVVLHGFIFVVMRGHRKKVLQQDCLFLLSSAEIALQSSIFLVVYRFRASNFN